MEHFLYLHVLAGINNELKEKFTFMVNPVPWKKAKFGNSRKIG